MKQSRLATKSAKNIKISDKLVFDSGEEQQSVECGTLVTRQEALVLTIRSIETNDEPVNSKDCLLTITGYYKQKGSPIEAAYILYAQPDEVVTVVGKPITEPLAQPDPGPHKRPAKPKPRKIFRG